MTLARPACLRTTVLAAVALLVCGPPAFGSTGSGVTYLGAGFTNAPFALGDDVVLETDGVWCSLRDYEDAVAPTWLGWYDASFGTGFWRDVLYDQGLAVALLTGLSAGATIVDVSDPRAPVAVGGFSGQEYSAGLLSGRMLYLATGNLLLAYDITQTTQPSLRFATVLADHAGPRWICKSGQLLYVLEAGATLRCLDIADPLAITTLGLVTLAGDRIDGLSGVGGVVYALLASDAGEGQTRLDLAAFDVHEPLLPIETRRLALVTAPAARGLQLRLRGDLLLASHNRDGLHAFAITTPTLPKPGWALPFGARQVAITSSRVLAFAGDTIEIIARGSPLVPPELLARRRVLPDLEQLTGGGRYQLAQSAKDRGLLYVVDAGDPTTPAIAGELASGYPGQLLHEGTVAMLVDQRGFQLVDLAEPPLLRRRGQERFPDDQLPKAPALGAWPGMALAAFGDAAAFATYLYDLTDLDSPRLASTIPAQNAPLALGDDLLLFRNLGAVEMYSVADPTQPVSLGTLPLGGPALRGVVAGGRAYTIVPIGGNLRLQVVDLTTPAAPRLTATEPLRENGRLAVHGDRLYVHSFGEVEIFTLADPDRPQSVAWLRPAFTPQRALAVMGNQLTVSKNLITVRDDTVAPTAVRSEQQPVRPRLEAPFPNPANPATRVVFHLERTTAVRVGVYDLRGRLVARLGEGAFAAGRHELTWNGVDDGQRPVASGVYLIQLAGSGIQAVQPVALVR